MNEDFNPSRRSFVKGALALGTLVAAEFFKPASLSAAVCAPTPPETAGPSNPNHTNVTNLLTSEF